MRRSSSTTRRWGASSAGTSPGSAMTRPRVSTALASRGVAPGDQAEHALAAILIEHRDEKAAGGLMRPRAEFIERARDAGRLEAGKLQRQRLAGGRDIEQTLAAVVLPLLLHHIALVDELFEHTAERLLGDLQDVQQVRDL